MHVDNNSRLIFIYQHNEMLTGCTYFSLPPVGFLHFSSVLKNHTHCRNGNMSELCKILRSAESQHTFFCPSHSPGTLTMPITLILWVRWDRKVGFQPGHSKINVLRLIIYLLWPLGRNYRSTGPLQLLNCVNLQMDQCA